VIEYVPVFHLYAFFLFSVQSYARHIRYVTRTTNQVICYVIRLITVSYWIIAAIVEHFVNIYPIYVINHSIIKLLYILFLLINIIYCTLTHFLFSTSKTV